MTQSRRLNTIFIVFILLFACVQCAPGSERFTSMLEASVTVPTQITLEKLVSTSTIIDFPLAVFGDNDVEISHATVDILINDLTKEEGVRVADYFKNSKDTASIIIPVSNVSGGDAVTIRIHQFSKRVLTYVGAFSTSDYTIATLQTSFESGGAAHDAIAMQDLNSFTMGPAYLDAQDRSVRIALKNDFSEVRVTRFTADGLLDDSFGNATGTVVTQLNNVLDTQAYKLTNVRWIVDEADGAFWAVFDAEQVANKDYPQQTTSKTVVMRFDESGQPDADFADGGYLPIDYELYNASTAGVVDEAGNLYLALNAIFFGDIPDQPYDQESVLVKIEKDGTIDSSFGEQGAAYAVTVGSGPTNIDAMVITDKDEILTASVTDENFVFARYAPDGELDENFGTLGTTDIPYVSAARPHIVAITLSRHGVATAVAQAVDTGEFYLMRLNELGLADEGFGAQGLVTHILAPAQIAVQDALKMDDERLIVFGQYNHDMALLMFIPNGGFDLEFANKGILSAVAGCTSEVTALSLTDNGDDVIASGSHLSMRVSIDTGAIDPTYGAALSGDMCSAAGL